jgi:putative transcriptional regulator
MAPGCARPPHRALDALLAGYAAGTLGAPLHALVAGHLAIDARSREFVRALEAAHGVSLEGIAPRPVSGRKAKLQAIFAGTEGESPASIPPPDPVLPAPLAQFLGKGLDAVPWRPLLPGIRAFTVERSTYGKAVLYRIRPGRKIPSHTHEGCEYTLVL